MFFAATGVTDGDLLRGVRYFSGGASTHSLVMRCKSGTGAKGVSRFAICGVFCLMGCASHEQGSDYSILQCPPVYEGRLQRQACHACAVLHTMPSTYSSCHLLRACSALCGDVPPLGQAVRHQHPPG